MNDLTIRFLKVYNYLLDKKIINNPSRFSKKIDISTSMMNEILKGRVNAGINPIQNIVNNFPQVNPTWLLTGKGTMILDNVETEEPIYKEQKTTIDKIIDEKLDKKISIIREEIMLTARSIILRELKNIKNDEVNNQ